MSSKPLSKRLFLKANYKLLIVDAPDSYQQLLGELPSGLEISTSPEGMYDVVHVFCLNREELEEKVLLLKEHLNEGNYMWISYPKGSSKVETDINRDSIWEYAKANGLKAVHQISIDDTWSAIRFKIV